ncbi:MAG: hypothetical protein ACQEQF_04220 [Bacillota bacterium]
MEISLNLFKFYDLAGPLTRSEIIENVNKMDLESANLERFQIDSKKGDPEYIQYPEPISFTLEKKLNEKERVDVIVKIYSYGAISFKVNIKPEVENINELNNFYQNSAEIKKIEEIFDKNYQLFYQQFSTKLKKKYYSKNNFTNLYPVYCISNTDYNDVKEVVENNREEVAKLLVGISTSGNYSEEQIENVLKYNTRFFKEDYSIIHWNGSLAISNEGNYKDLLYIIELANIQFVKLRSYDAYIDNYLSEYLDLSKKKLSKGIEFFNPISKTITNITKMRVEFEKITDMMDNFEKFFGKWYMAKIYYLASSSFEIPRWKKLIESRLETVDDLYTMINNERNRKKMLFLNFLMLLLFILWFFI